MFIKARGPSKSGEHNLLQGNENTGSAFRREQRDGDTFEISFINTVGPMDAFDIQLYVAVNNAVSGMGSIILGEGESVVCEMEGNSIRVLSPRPGYLGFDQRTVVFVADKGAANFEWQMGDAGNVREDPRHSQPSPPIRRVPNSNNEVRRNYD